ncbi:MAG: GTP pyrophosphokinase family protein [Clostridia bacterium]|nr:GTP pyrophosphokinase family protein [Clostridia bacterium]MBQ6646411.1 GTP pyrophosphokinase family protein [Clostridia bacterium]MBQ9408714.1 GTP pyrophosphokinase family protein [Clostridia bacterium]
MNTKNDNNSNNRALSPLQDQLLRRAEARAAGMIMAQAKQMMNTMVDYKELMTMYACAMKQVRTKFEVLDSEFNVRYQRNPINAINTRLKKTASIIEKLSRKHKAFTCRDIEENLFDVAGVRVICSYSDDIYRIADAFLSQDDVTLIRKKDYIAEPKENGYRSLHLIVKVPVYFSEMKKDMAVEVQIRTIAMDFWANLEHQLKYKQEIPDQTAIVKELKTCADVLAGTDDKMLSLRTRIEKMEDTQESDSDVLLEKLSKLDIAIDQP